MSNLLEKASIITTPTAYSDGKLHSVKPVQTLGNELVTNGSFDTDTNWVKQAAWSINNGTANCDGTSGSIYQSSVVEIGKSYLCEFEVTSIISGSVAINAGGITTGTLRTSVGTYSEILYVVGGSNDRAYIISQSFQGSIDNVSIKEVIDADFDFQRGSAATRVNSQGLIENVQTLSGNLVQNGDFSEIGSEEIVNGDFATDSDWTKQAGWSISDGSANCDTNNNVQLYQDNVVQDNKFYKITYTVSNYQSGGVFFRFNSLDGNTRTENGTYTEYLKAPNGSFGRIHLRALANVGFVGSIDNISVKEVGQNWTVGTGWSIGENKAVAVSTSVSTYQISNIVSGKTYLLKWDITDYTSGLFALAAGGNVINYWKSASGTYSETVIAGSSGNIELRCSAFNGSVTNISVIEVTDDTDLPRIDYTDGCGSLLLEPQSTNLLPYSEDFSQWIQFGSPTIVQNIISPNGTLNGTQLTRGSNQTALRYYNVTTLNQEYTFSVYAKKGSVDTMFLDIGDVTNAGFTLTDEWQRFTVSSTPTTYTHIDISLGTSVSGDYIHIWGAQLEQLSYPTSYIPTNGSTATRLADVCNNAGSSDLINSTEGVLYAEISALANDLTRRIITITDGTLNNIVKLEYKNVSNQIEAVLYNGTTQCLILHTLSDETEFNKIAFKYKQNDFSLFINGVRVGTDINGVVFAPNTLNNLSFYQGNSNNLYGKVKSVVVFKEALTNDELEGLTGEGYDTFNALALANNYTII